MESVEIETLRHRLYRWMKSENIVQRKAIQVAQNTRHNKEIIDDFVTYVNEQIECFFFAYAWGEIRADSIINTWSSIGIKTQSRIAFVDV